jgi:hypothetical protein
MSKLINLSHNTSPGPLPRNPKYSQLCDKIRKVSRAIESKKAAGLFPSREESREKRSLLAQRRKTKSTTHSKHFSLKYVRYADDWLVGIWGSRRDAVKIRDKARQFLETLGLELSMEKTLITNTRAERAKFLGTHIKRIAGKEPIKMVTRSNGLKARCASTGNLSMTPCAT